MSRTVLISALALTLYFAGCVGGTDPANGSADRQNMAPTGADPLGADGPSTRTEDFTLSASWATPVRSFNNGGPTTLMTPGKNITGFLVEISWKASSPASERMSVWIRKEGDGAVSPDNPTFLINSPPPLKQADGASPIKIALPTTLFKETVNYQVYLRASAAPVGAAVNQPAKLFLTTFTEIPFDEAYSAIPK